MKKEIAQLVMQKIWEQVNHNYIPPGTYGKPLRVLKGTWELKLKRLPEETSLK